MRRTFLTLIVGSLLAFGHLAGAMGQSVDAYIAARSSERPELKHSLTLREEQGGAGGLSGVEWTIRPDGKWELVRFCTVKGKEEKLGSSLARGELTSAQLTELGQVLASADLNGLPPKIGPAPEPAAIVNPHRFVLIFGDKKIVLSGVEARRGGDLLRNIHSVAHKCATEQVHQLDRFGKVASAVVAQTRPS
jgi:hypothetical protein